jgi:hypothetical protein
LSAEPQVPDVAVGRALLALILAGGLVVAALGAGAAFAVDRPALRLVQAIGPHALIGLVVGSLLCFAAGRLRGPVSYEGLELLVGVWAVFRLALCVALMMLIVAWLGAFAAGLAAAARLAQAFLLTLIGGALIGILGTAAFNLRRALRGPARA